MSFGEDRIIRKSPEEIEKMRRSGKMVRQVLNHLKGVVAAGGTTMDLEQAAEKMIADLGAAPALHGYYGDAAITVPVGEELTPELKKLLEVTEASLYKGIEQVKIGNTVGHVGSAIQKHVEANGFSVVREFVGHGIGTKLHEAPQIPNFGKKGQGAELTEGMVLAIEPMVNSGRPETKVLSDKWTAVTLDGSYSAHFEHCVAVTRQGPMILTQ